MPSRVTLGSAWAEGPRSETPLPPHLSTLRHPGGTRDCGGPGGRLPTQAPPYWPGGASLQSQCSWPQEPGAAARASDLWMVPAGQGVLVCLVGKESPALPRLHGNGPEDPAPHSSEATESLPGSSTGPVGVDCGPPQHTSSPAHTPGLSRTLSHTVILSVTRRSQSSQRLES